MQKPIIVAITSDTHTNSTLGLCPPRVMLDDGGQYVASAAQRWVWRKWLDYTNGIDQLARRYNAKVVTVLNGDVFDGDHHNTAQIITRNPATMQRIAYEALRPLVDISEQVFVVRGTESHVGTSASHEETFAADLTNSVPDEKAGAASWWWLPLNVNGVRFDIGHHGRMGTRPWTAVNALNALVVQVAMSYYRNGERPPHLLIRAHRHTPGDTGDNHETRGIALPSWQLQTAHGNRLSPGIVLPIGGIAVICYPDGRYEVQKFISQPPRRSVHKVVIDD